MKSIKKIVCNENGFKSGGREICLAKIRDWSEKNELMVLGRDGDTNELIWTQAPTFEFLADFTVDTLYHVTIPKMRIEKRFPSNPVNKLFKCSFTECQSSLSDDILNELAEFSDADLDAGTEMYFELADKSGDVFRNGICRPSFLEKLSKWSKSIGGTFYSEQFC